MAYCNVARTQDSGRNSEAKIQSKHLFGGGCLRSNYPVRKLHIVLDIEVIQNYSMVGDECMVIGVIHIYDDQSKLDIFPSLVLLAKLSSSYLLKCCQNHPI